MKLRCDAAATARRVSWFALPFALSLTLAFVLPFALSPPLARADEGDVMLRRVQDLLHAHQAEIFGCVRSVTGQAPEGEMLVRLVVGEHGQVARAEVLKDQSNGGPLGACIVEHARHWDVHSLQAAPGDQVVLPLAFHPDRQILIPAHSLAVRSAVRAPGVMERRFADAPLALSVVSLEEGGYFTLPGATALCVLDGQVALLGGRAAARLHRGDAAWVPTGLKVAVSTRHPARLLMVTPKAAPPPAGMPVGIVLGAAAHSKSVRIPGGAGTIRPLLRAGQAPLSLSLVSAAPGARLPLAADTLLYVVHGHGTAAVGETAVAAGPDDTLQIPDDTGGTLRVETPLLAVQIAKGPR